MNVMSIGCNMCESVAPVSFEGRECSSIDCIGRYVRTLPTTEAPLKSTNPKDLIGILKPNLAMVPMIAVYTMAKGLADGVRKYGLFNWRESNVQADIYVEAAKRHINAWAACEENAADSGVHHLGHAMACMAILIDAQANKSLVDNRVPDSAYLEWMKQEEIQKETI